MRGPKKGYKLPSDVDADTRLVCYSVYVPERFEYVTALAGALRFMGTWVAWEKDDAGMARVAAGLWRDANARTFPLMPCHASEDSPPVIVPIGMAQRKDEKMCCCCCGCCDGGIQEQDLPGVGDDAEFVPPVDSVVPGDTANPVADEWRCHMSTYLADEIGDFLTGVSLVAGGAGASMAAVLAAMRVAIGSGLMASLLAPAFVVAGSFLYIVGWVMSVGVGAWASLMGLAAAWWADNEEFIVCLMYTAVSPAVAKERVIDYVNNNLNALPGIKWVIVFFIRRMDFDVLDDVNSLVIPDEHRFGDCSDCADGYASIDEDGNPVSVPGGAGWPPVVKTLSEWNSGCVIDFSSEDFVYVPPPNYPYGWSIDNPGHLGRIRHVEGGIWLHNGNDTPLTEYGYNKSGIGATETGATFISPCFLDESGGLLTINYEVARMRDADTEDLQFTLYGFKSGLSSPDQIWYHEEDDDAYTKWIPIVGNEVVDLSTAPNFPYDYYILAIHSDWWLLVTVDLSSLPPHAP